MATHTLRTRLLVIGTLAVVLGLHVIDRVPAIPRPQILENRDLAPAPGVPRGLADLTTLPTRMDAYVADHVPARQHLIAALNYMRYRLGYSATEKVVVGRDGWLFYDDGRQSSRQPVPPMGPVEAAAWVEAFAKRTASLQARGIAYVALVPPLKEALYPEVAPPRLLEDPRVRDAGILAPLARQAGLTNLLWLRPAMHRARAQEPRLYSPYDTHWTGLGAYLGYRELMAALVDEGVGAPLPRGAFHTLDLPSSEQPRDLALMSGIAGYIRQDYPQLEARSPIRPQITYLTARQDWASDRVIETGSAGKPVLVVTGDSFTNELLPFLYPHFSRIVFAHNETLHYRPDLIEAYAPDVVLLLVHEPNLRLAVYTGAADLVLAPGIRLAIPGDGAAAVSCSIDSLVQARMPDGAPSLEVRGWVADAERGRRTGTATVVLQSDTMTYRASVPVNLEREDVAAYFKMPALKQSGFYFSGSAAQVAPGRYALYLIQTYGDDALVCTPQRTLEVPAP